MSTLGWYLCLAAVLSGCAAEPKPMAVTADASTDATRFTHRAASHVTLFWNCVQGEAGVLRLDGMAANPSAMQPVKFLEFELVGVDAGERSVSATWSEAPNIQLFTNQSTPFQLVIRPTGREARFDLYYQYRFQDGGKDKLIASADSRLPILAQQVMRFLVRDVCSPSLHRNY